MAEIDSPKHPVLELGNKYTREQVHDVFDRYSVFKSGTGTWGLHGIVKVSNRYRSYVFFVTFGQSQAGHEFKEDVTDDGILTWQSQPKLRLSDPDIVNFINHNHLTDSIHLFLRTQRINPETKTAEPFTYLGKLAYVTHDTGREQPVWFKWQLPDWEQVKSAIDESVVYKEEDESSPSDDATQQGLVKTGPPSSNRKTTKGVPSNQFMGKHFDFSGTESKRIGLLGEQLVFEYEKSRLVSAGQTWLTR